MGKELEMKYDCSGEPGLMETIQQDFAGEWENIQMVSTYFDTEKKDFSQKRWTLRLRLENGEQVITCKTPGADGTRNEWECPALDLSSGIEHLIAMGAPSILEEYLKKGLAPVCGARFQRRRRLIQDDFGEGELALDEGFLFGGEKSLFFREVEMEFKRGNEQAFLQWCHTLSQKYGLRLQRKSKYARAVTLSEE